MPHVLQVTKVLKLMAELSGYLSILLTDFDTM
jgi:hypothetical protein